MNFSGLYEMQGMLFSLMLLGALLKRMGIITGEGKKVLADLVIYVTLPCSIIKSFENLIREKVPERSIDLSEWKYCEVLPSEIFKQKINEILLFDYESASLYDKRSGKTLVAFYYRCPKGRVYRKRKEYRYLSRPDFDNWINA